MLIHTQFVNLDTLEGGLCEIAKEDLLQVTYDSGYGGQVQAQGSYLSDLECDRYFDVL